MEKDLEYRRKINEIINLESNENIEDSLENLVRLEIKSNATGVDLGQTFTYTIIVYNDSNKDLLDVKITHRVENELRLADVMIEAINILDVDRYNKSITLYIDEIKAKERKSIDIIVEVVNTENSNLFESNAKLEGKYIITEGNERNIVTKSNNCSVKVVTPKLVLTKKSLVLEAVVGEDVTFTILAENKGNLDIDNVVIRDILKPELKFLDYTIKIDGVSKADESILSGVNIGTLKEGESKKIEFKANILCRSEIGVVKNISIGQYEYKISGEDRIREGNTVSNENNIVVQVAKISIEKVADKEEISLGDEIKYSIEIINDGTLEAKNIVLNESISDSFELIAGKFTIDGQVINNINLERGILIGDLLVGEKRLITYMVKYNSANNCNKVINETKINFNYKQTAGLIFRGAEVIKDLEISTTISNFKYISVSDKICVNERKPSIEDVSKVLAEVNIIEYHLIKTMQGKSNEGQILTGYKIVIQGTIKEVAEYTAEQLDQSVYTVCSNIPFSAFIVLPSNFKEGSKISVDYKVEDISYKRRDSNCIYTNVCLLLIAKVQPYIML